MKKSLFTIITADLLFTSKLKQILFNWETAKTIETMGALKPNNIYHIQSE